MASSDSLPYLRGMMDSPGPPERLRGASAPAFRHALLTWFDAHRRELPWRETEEPYRIWVSEVMLQQTRVETVLPYYRRWMERFPDLGSLAGADEEEVLRIWKGLGYYARARNLHRAAALVQERHGGRLPDDPESLQGLPGVGAYTAGAVASIAFGRPVPAVDGNVRRVLSRLMDVPSPTPARLRRWAAGLMDPRRPGDFNQALMELGAMVCTPTGPVCETCPVEVFCEASEQGTAEKRPRRAPRKPKPTMELGVAVLAFPPDPEGEAGPGARLLFRRRASEGLLGGLWEFPARTVRNRPAAGPAADGVREELDREGAAGAARDLGLLPGCRGERLPEVAHSFSHLHVRYRPFLYRSTREEGRRAFELVARRRESLRLVPASALEALPLPVAQTRIAEEALDRLQP